MVKIDKNTGESFVKILEIMSALRDPKTGCEWDKDQDSNANSKKQIEKNWADIKQQERIAKGNTGLLDDIPKNFPAMIRSLKLQKRASENGFDWKNPNDTFKKIEEEKKELEIAIIQQESEGIEEEIGDLIFSVINLSRKLKIDPENALRKTNNKFSARINYIEKELQKQNKNFNQSNLVELEKLWNQAKIDIKQVK